MTDVVTNDEGMHRAHWRIGEVVQASLLPGSWTFPDVGRLGYSRPLRRFLLAQQLGQHVTHVHDIAHIEREPVWIDVAFEKPDRPEIFEQELGCEVRFGKSSTAIVYDMSILDDRPPMTNPVTHAMLRETCEGLIGAVEYGGGLAGQVARH